jgi:hypothetical protein
LHMILAILFMVIIPVYIAISAERSSRS